MITIVMGMHRSGTSALAGLLFHGKMFLGRELMPPKQYNPKGYYEDTEFVELNESILSSIDLNWMNTADCVELDKVSKSIILKMSKIYMEYKDIYGEWAWKDPRICITFPLWYEVLKHENLHILFIMMNPLSVAISLNKRQRLPIQHGLSLWKKYNVGVVKHINQYGLQYTFLTYEHLLENPQKMQLYIENQLERKLAENVWEFIDQGLNHSNHQIKINLYGQYKIPYQESIDGVLKEVRDDAIIQALNGYVESIENNCVHF